MSNISPGKVHSKKILKKLKTMNTQESSSSSPNKAGTSALSKSENVLSLPLVKSVDRDRLLPRFSSVLKRNEDEGVGMEDLDALQLELEALLSAAVVKSRALRKEMKTVNSAERRVKKEHRIKKVFPSTGKRGGAQNRVMTKPKGTKLQELERTPSPIKLTKVKSIPATITAPPNINLPELDSLRSEKEESPKTTQSRYDLPNKFWASVDAYCTEITEDDIRFLKDLSKAYDSDIEELTRIPPLGQHYSLRWAHEDLLSEQKESAAEAKDTNRGSSPEVEVIFEKVRKRKLGRATSTPLTQRLVSALMDENVKVHGSEGSNSKTVGGENIVPRPNLFRSYVSSSSNSFERRVRKEVEEIGEGDVIDLGSESESDENDEILKEIKNCQAQLRSINFFNRQHINRIIQVAEAEIKRQELKKNLQKIDNEVMENYRFVVAAKQKKKALAKSEQDKCWQLLKERSALAEQIDALK